MSETQNWQKLKLVITADPKIPWLNYGMGACFVEEIDQNTARLYIGARSTGNISQIGTVDIKVSGDELEVCDDSQQLLLGVGEQGCFDERGVSYPWIVKEKNNYWLYYTGWVAGGITGFQNHLGLALSKDSGKSFERISRAPILERTNTEPFGTGSVAVIKDGSEWLMYYTCFQKWEKHENKYQPFYNIKIARSDDGINWKRENHTAIDFNSNDENVIAKPMPFFENGIWKIYYCYRSLHSNYQIGYAESKDGLEWQRKDELINIPLSESGWDSEMMEYAFIFKLNGQKYMAYNGNDFGKSGIGFAKLY